MTLAEFKAWLDGYLSAGGSDLDLIKGKLADTHETLPFVPSKISPYHPDYPGIGRWPEITCTSNGVTQ